MARDLGVSYTNKQPYYFISYNKEDEKRVAKYAAELAKLNVPLWYDNGIKIGSEWENEIAERIDKCEAVIMFLSKNIFLKEKSYVHSEFELATNYSHKKVYIMMLDDIPGVGKQRKIQLLRTFGSVAALRKVSPEEIAEKIPGLGIKVAEKICETLSAKLPRNDRISRS